MSDPPPFIVILTNGPLSPAEDLETALTAAAQSQSLGLLVMRIEQGGRTILEGDELTAAIAKAHQ